MSIWSYSLIGSAKKNVALASHYSYKLLILLPYPYTSLDKNFGKILCRARRIQRMKQASVADDVGDLIPSNWSIFCEKNLG